MFDTTDTVMVIREDVSVTLRYGEYGESLFVVEAVSKVETDRNDATA